MKQHTFQSRSSSFDFACITEWDDDNRFRRFWNLFIHKANSDNIFSWCFWIVDNTECSITVISDFTVSFSTVFTNSLDLDGSIHSSALGKDSEFGWGS